ncbi:MAG: integrase arm-type DNA-binding domain-containing protein [Paracoccaceae bacterium]|nr:integrase arm-type DNA-binding domain-containing protein [Paracoccaceae bacterium]
MIGSNPAKMPKEIVNALTPARVRQEKRPGRIADGQGLYLHISETGGRWWVWRGTVHGKRRELGIGSARLIPLAEAREKARLWRRTARDGGDPEQERDRAKMTALTVEGAARKVWGDQIEPHAKNPKHSAQWIRTLKVYAFPHIGARPVHTITQGDILRVLAPIWTEKPETARRVRQRLRTVFDWARTAGHFDGVNPIEGIERGLPKQRDRVQHHRALPYGELPVFMRRVETIDGVGALALRFTILTAARSGEVRNATWAEIGIEARTWTIPASRMKAQREHRVPISDAAVCVLDRVRALSDDLVFPGTKPGRPVSDMTLSAVLRRLDVDATVHGFRSTFRDWAAEQTSFAREIAELCLAHEVGNAVERAYRRSDLFDKRRELMEQWAVFCTSGVDAE